MNAPPDRLAEAEQTIARQTAELADLRHDLADQAIVQRLRDAVQLALTAGTIATPVTHTRLVALIVNAAARVIRAQAASLFLLDEASEELVMEYPVGPMAPEIARLRVPLGHGIAGLVAANGQPMAVSEASADPRHAADIASQIGYRPRSILCVPLVRDDEVIGVLEAFDKEGADGFSSDDMEILSVFAEQAAIAIEQSRNYANLAGLIREVLESLTAAPEEGAPTLRTEAQSLAATLGAGSAYGRALEVARVVQGIGQYGEAELAACQALIQAFADYLHQRPGFSGSGRGPA